MREKYKGKKVHYFVEGECEEKLIRSLIDEFSLLPPGKIKVLNTKQKMIPKSILLNIKPSSYVVLVFDTDVDAFSYLIDNNKALEKLIRIKTILLPQVKNFEDEMIRSCSLQNVKDLTHSRSNKDFKRDFIKASNIKMLLAKSNFDFSKLWSQELPPALKVYENGKKNLCI